MSRNDPYVSVLHMLDNARGALDLYEERARRGDWQADAMLIDVINDALVRRMEVLGEASRRVPQNFRSRYPNVPWVRITDLRNLLIHEYDRVNLPLLESIIRDEVPPLVAQLESIIAERDG